MVGFGYLSLPTTMEQNLKKTRLELLVVFVLYLFLLPSASMELDMGYWQDWALKIHHMGLGHAYDTSINYFPVYLYGLWFFDWLQGTDANIIAHISSIKILFVCFDFLPLVVLCGFRNRLLQFKIPYLFLLLNVAYVFNSMIWGQIDSIYTNLSFLAVVSALANPVSGAVLYLLALNTKAQSIEFFPVVALVLWYSIRNLKTGLKVLGAVAAVQFIILLPFIPTGGVPKLWHHATHAVDLYRNLSICAFNIWYLISSGNPYTIDDHTAYFLFSYKTYGLTFFTVSALLVLWPMYRNVRMFRTKQQEPNGRFYEILFLGAGLICLFFFYFNSQMHERYAHPIVILFFFYGVVSGNYKLYVLASIPYLLSLDKCYSYPDGFLPIYHYKLIYASRILAIWYTLSVVYGGYLYYNLIKNNNIFRSDLRPEHI